MWAVYKEGPIKFFTHKHVTILTHGLKLACFMMIWNNNHMCFDRFILNVRLKMYNDMDLYTKYHDVSQASTCLY
jgi:hypothetical protein